MTDKIRIAKYINTAGYCSRRKAEELIAQGRVQINKVTIDSPVNFVGSSDVVTVDREIIKKLQDDVKLWAYYKPKGLVTTHDDPQNRPTIFSELPDFLPRVVSIGRLDINSEGLLLLTNSGHLSNKIAIPSNNYKRIYKVRARGMSEAAMLEFDKLNKGLIIEGINTKPIKIEVITNKGYNNWFQLTLTEGKNREIRKLFEHLGLEVNRLIRTDFGPFNLDSAMKPGDVKELNINKLSFDYSQLN